MSDNMEFYLNENGMKTDLDFGELVISGDEQLGFRPFQLMVSSIVGCSGMVLKRILEKQRIEFEIIRITADVKRDPDDANRIEQVKITFIIKGNNLSSEKLYKNLEIANKNCAMVRSVEDSIKIEKVIEIVE